MQDGYKHIDIPEVGTVDFPDTMSDDDIAAASKKLMEEHHPDKNEPTFWEKLKTPAGLQQIANSIPIISQSTRGAQRVWGAANTAQEELNQAGSDFESMKLSEAATHALKSAGGYAMGAWSFFEPAAEDIDRFTSALTGGKQDETGKPQGGVQLYAAANQMVGEIAKSFGTDFETAAKLLQSKDPLIMKVLEVASPMLGIIRGGKLLRKPGTDTPFTELSRTVGETAGGLLPFIAGAEAIKMATPFKGELGNRTPYGTPEGAYQEPVDRWTSYQTKMAGAVSQAISKMNPEMRRIELEKMNNWRGRIVQSINEARTDLENEQNSPEPAEIPASPTSKLRKMFPIFSQDYDNARDALEASNATELRKQRIITAQRRLTEAQANLEFVDYSISHSQPGAEVKKTAGYLPESGTDVEQPESVTAGTNVPQKPGVVKYEEPDKSKLTMQDFAGGEAGEQVIQQTTHPVRDAKTGQFAPRTGVIDTRTGKYTPQVMSYGDNNFDMSKPDGTDMKPSEVRPEIRPFTLSKNGRVDGRLGYYNDMKRGVKVKEPDPMKPYIPAVELKDGTVAWSNSGYHHGSALFGWLEDNNLDPEKFDYEQIKSSGGIASDGHYYSEKSIGDVDKDLVLSERKGIVGISDRFEDWGKAIDETKNRSITPCQ
jgi:hypothetical protein